MVNACSETSRLEEFNRIEVSNINATLIRRRALIIVLLHVEAKETDIDAFDLLESEEDFCAEFELFGDWVSSCFSLFTDARARFDSLVAHENGTNVHMSCFVVFVIS